MKRTLIALFAVFALSLASTQAFAATVTPEATLGCGAGGTVASPTTGGGETSGGAEAS